jgi:F0F1-type ATP synthase delta subunit
MMSEIEKYLRQLLDLIYQKDDLEQILFDLSLFADHIGYSSKSKGKGDESANRQTLIETNLTAMESPILRDYFQGLIKKKDLWLFDPGHFKIFVQEVQELSQKAIFFNLITACEINNKDIKKLVDKLSVKAQKKVMIQLIVDKSIIGGAIIKKDNFILDYSLKTKLNNLSSQWKKSIQKAV